MPFPVHRGVAFRSCRRHRGRALGNWSAVTYSGNFGIESAADDGGRYDVKGWRKGPFCGLWTERSDAVQLGKPCFFRNFRGDVLRLFLGILTRTIR